MTILIYCVIFGLIAIIFTLIFLHYFERKDLYNRIMSKDLKEYENIGKELKPIKRKHQAILDRWRGRAE